MGSNHVACVSIFAKSKNARGYNQRVCNGTRYLNMGIRGLSPSLLSHKSTPTLIKVHNSVDVEGTNLGASKKNHQATIDEKRTFFIFAATHGLSESKFPYLFHPWPPIAQETLLLIQTSLMWSSFYKRGHHGASKSNSSLLRMETKFFTLQW